MVKTAIKPVNYAHINIVDKGYWKIRIEFLRPIFAKIELK